MLVIEAGGSKTSWLFGDKESPELRLTGGFNPVRQEDEELKLMLDQIREASPGNPEEVHYYGAGCFDSQYIHRIGSLLETYFKEARIHVKDDLQASVKALLGDNPGIAVILGTGTNSCKYDGHAITQQIPASGFVLGDEGSGANLGRMLITAWLYGEFEADLSEAAERWCGFDKIAYKRHFYENGASAKSAAKWAIFAHQNQDESKVQKLIGQNFDQFVQRILLKYNPEYGQEIHFTGGMAWYFKDYLEKSLQKAGFRLGQVLQDAGMALWQYHLQNKNKTIR